MWPLSCPALSRLVAIACLVATVWEAATECPPIPGPFGAGPGTRGFGRVRRTHAARPGGDHLGCAQSGHAERGGRRGRAGTGPSAGPSPPVDGRDDISRTGVPARAAVRTGRARRRRGRPRVTALPLRCSGRTPARPGRGDGHAGRAADRRRQNPRTHPPATPDTHDQVMTGVDAHGRLPRRDRSAPADHHMGVDRQLLTRTPAGGARALAGIDGCSGSPSPGRSGPWPSWPTAAEALAAVLRSARCPGLRPPRGAYVPQGPRTAVHPPTRPPDRKRSGSERGSAARRVRNRGVGPVSGRPPGRSGLGR